MYRITAILITVFSISVFTGCGSSGGGGGDALPVITISDAQVTEGDSGNTTLSFTVSIDKTSDAMVTVDYSTSDVTAEAGTDYMTYSGELWIWAGDTTGQINITVYGDIDIESDETFTLTLATPENATLGTTTATGTILNDDVLVVKRVDPTSDTMPYDGLTWASAYHTIGEAVDSVTEGVNVEVWVAAGTYTNGSGTGPVLTLKDGMHVFGGFEGYASGTGAQETSYTLDWPAHETVLDGEDSAYHVVIGATDAWLIGCTVTGGNANNSGSWVTESGGGLFDYNTGDESTYAGFCTFTGNYAYRGGAAWGKDQTQITCCIFEDNTAMYGGAVCIQGSSASGVISHCVFNGNSAGDAGGALDIESSGKIIGDTIFINNKAVVGGAVRTRYTSDMTFINCTFIRNNATSFGGGAMTNHASSDPSIINCIFDKNTAEGGSPVINNDTSTPTFSYCCFTGCGGSGAGWDTSLGTDGGGNIDADPVLVNVPDRVDIHVTGGTTSTVELTDASTNYAVDDIIEVGNDGTARTVTGVSGTTVTFTPVLADPCPPHTMVSNWGAGASDLVLDLHLDTGSPCIDAGWNNPGISATDDLDLNPRFVDDPAVTDTGSGTAPIIDIGAYEKQ